MKGSVRRSLLLRVTTVQDGVTVCLIEEGLALLRFLSSRNWLFHVGSMAEGTDGERILCGNG